MRHQYPEYPFRESCAGIHDVPVCRELGLPDIFHAYQGKAVRSATDYPVTVQKHFHAGFLLQLLESPHAVFLLLDGIIPRISAIVVIAHYREHSVPGLHPAEDAGELFQFLRVNVDNVPGEQYQVRPGGVDLLHDFFHCPGRVAVCPDVQIGNMGNPVPLE